MYFSKSKYTSFWKCPKRCWIETYKPELQEVGSAAQSRIEEGHKVGELAKGLFGKYEEATVCKPDGTLDLPAMIEKTRELLASGANVICEAAFSYNGLYCAVDILRKENDGYAIYEVKSSSEVKDYYIADVAYQKYVLQKCGIKLVGVHVVILNNKYVKQGELDVRKLFAIDGGSDISQRIAKEEALVESTLAQAEKVIGCQDEPDVDFDNKRCKKDGVWCDYWKFCSRHLPKPNVFELYNCRDKWAYYQRGIVTFDDVVRHGVKLKNPAQELQVAFAHSDDTYINKEEIKRFLDTLSYPLYFLDFETIQLTIPEFDGTRPFQTLPCQYSLHYVEREDGEVHHAEFLAKSGVDPRRALAERLVNDIPQNVCTLAYNASTERGIVNKLANIFPDLSEHLHNIAEGIKDLLPTFQHGHYYNRKMGGSFSIKTVLPAVFPNDPELDYHNLEGVQNGTEAMEIFPKIKNMSPDEAKRTREQLLKYCKLDTYAMVKLWQELVRVSK